MTQQAKSERINMRASAEAVELLRDAAQVHGQDLTSFVLGAALGKARQTMIEEKFLKLSPAAMQQLEDALDGEASAPPGLVELFERYR